MNFTELLQILNEAKASSSTPKVGQSIRKERLKSNATNNKAKDAARKRAERSREVPRERKSKQELIKEILLVKTKSGRVQLIFKDSYNKTIHEILNKTEMTMEEAQQVLKDPKFEQTRASKLLFGNVKEKSKTEKESSDKKAEEKKQVKKEGQKKQSQDKEEQEEGPKARRMSKEEIFKIMSQMDGEQLSQMPPEMRQEYFKMTRNPPSNSDFDNMSYEALSVKFNLNPLSNLPYNQQVLNALMFLAKMKAGAGEQELQTYGALAPAAMEFTRSAFFTAKKILSQIGDECIQNLVSNVEVGGKAINAEGAVDMQCGNYKFKISAGGEMSLSTNQFDQSNKSFRGLVAGALMQALSNPALIQSDPKLGAAFQQTQQQAQAFSTMLIPDDVFQQISQDPGMIKQLQATKFKDAAGNDIGPAVDENGNLNPRLSLSGYQSQWLNLSKTLLSGSKSGEKSPIRALLSNSLLKTTLRGDNILPPEQAANHLITVNGVFPLSDQYFDAISKTADLDIKPSKDVISSSNISNYKVSAAEMLKKFRTIIESKEKTSLKDLLVNIKSIDPIQLMISNIVDNNDFSLNASLLPGFSPKDLNAVEYNFLKIGKKTIKIPVQSNEKISNQILGEAPIILNDMILESIENEDILQALHDSGLITLEEAGYLERYQMMIYEGHDTSSIIQTVFNNAWNRAYEQQDKMFLLFDILQEKYVRDYKKEYKNYHGKPKQRKERAARTKAREMMIKKGKVKKGDGKDIDHKKPLRNGGSKGINNLRIRDKSNNRSDNGHHKGEKQNKGSWK